MRKGGRKMALTKEKIINDVYNVVAFKRSAFQPTITPSSSNIIVNVGYNLPTTA